MTKLVRHLVGRKLLGEDMQYQVVVCGSLICSLLTILYKLDPSPPDQKYIKNISKYMQDIQDK